MAKTKTSATVKNRYAAKAYDRIAFIVPKGHKGTIERAAKAEEESINGYVNNAVLARMGLEEWPEKEENAAPVEDSDKEGSD